MASSLSLTQVTFPIVCCFLTTFVCLSQAGGNLSVQLNAYHNTERQKQFALPSKPAPAQFRFAFTLHGQTRDSSGRQQLLSYNQSAGTSYTDTTGLVTFAKHAGDAAFAMPFSVHLDDKLERTADLQVTVTEPVATTAVISAKLVAEATTDSVKTPIKIFTQNATSPDGNHVLEYSYWLVCQPGSYGPQCDRSCVAQDSDKTGHYFCSHDTGNKVCLAGWTDPLNDCKIRFDTAPSSSGVSSTPEPPTPPPPVDDDANLTHGLNAWQAQDKPKGLGNPGIIITITVALAFVLVASVGCIAVLNLNISDEGDGPDPQDNSEQNPKKAAAQKSKR